MYFLRNLTRCISLRQNYLNKKVVMVKTETNKCFYR